MRKNIEWKILIISSDRDNLQIMINHDVKGPYRQKKSLLFIRFWREFAHVCKIEIKMGNRHENFSIFVIENEWFTENVEKGVCGNEPNGQTVQPTQLIHVSIEAEFRALQNYGKFFFRISF